MQGVLILQSFFAKTIFQQQRLDHRAIFLLLADQDHQLFPARDLLDVTLQRLPDEAVTILGSAQTDTFGAEFNEMILQHRLIFEIALLFAFFDLVERRLSDKQVAVFHQLGHLPVEKSKQQGPNMRAVDIGVGHDDDRMVAQLRFVIIFFDAGSQRHNHQANFLG